MSIVRKAGTTDVSVVIRIIDSADGTPETGVTSATGGLALEYRREGAVSTAITEADLTNLNAAHSDGGMKHIGNGYYRLDLPDAACASGVAGVLVHGTVTGMVVIGEYIQLTAYDPFDTVRLGLTALPNAAPDAAGGLPISDAGGLDLDAKLANTNEVTAARMGALTDWIDGGRLDLILDAALADTNELQTDWANGGRLDLLIDATLADTNELQTDWVNGGRLDLLIDAILADTNELQTDFVNGGRLDLLIDAIKAKSDSLTFTVAGQVDANIQYVNDVQIQGDGQSGTEWGPV